MNDFEIREMDLRGGYIILTKYIGDVRGSFTKNFENELFDESGINFTLSESFYSKSAKNVLRGLHFQLNNPQAKLVTVISGSVWDVVVDLRSDSKTYKEWRAYELSDKNHLELYIPEGFAHGFLSLEENTIMLYQCDGRYDFETDTGIMYNDPEIGIKWPEIDGQTIHSDRDMNLMSFDEYENIIKQ